MKMLDVIWDWTVSLLFMLPLFGIGWLIGEAYLNLRAGFVWAQVRKS